MENKLTVEDLVSNYYDVKLIALNSGIVAREEQIERLKEELHDKSNKLQCARDELALMNVRLEK